MDTLRTARLVIRPFTMDDLEEVHRLLDQDLQWAGADFPLERRRERLQLQVGLARWADTGQLYGNRGLILPSTGELIGFVHLHPELWSPAWKQAFWPALLGLSADDPALADASVELSIGYALATRHRRQGYAAEAVGALLGYLFQELLVGRVLALTDRANDDSVRLMRRVGMRVARHPDPEVVYPAFVGVIERSGGGAA